MRSLRFLLGSLLVVSFFALWANVGFTGELGRSFVMLGKGELLFWTSHSFVLLPGLLLLVFAWPALETWIAQALRRLAPFFAGKAPRLLGWGLLLVLLAMLGTRLGRSALLQDLAITGDEHMVLFGARMVAEGELSVPTSDSRLGLNNAYLYEKDGRTSAMDFPGIIFFRAASLRLHAGFWPFALLAAFSWWALVQAIAQHEGRLGGLLAAAWLLSPMVVSLSLTEHSHLLSRSLVALGWALYLRILATEGEASPRPPAGWQHAGLALLFAGAFLARPAEAAVSFLPVFIDLGLRAARARNLSRLFLLAVPALAGPGLLMLYNQALTGSPLVSPRVLGTVLLVKPGLLLFWERLGNNSLFNAVLLVLYFLGPLGLLAMLAALGRRVAPVMAAMAAVLLQILLGLLHGDTGIHLVGPIHYSECAVPLLVLAVWGVPKVVELAVRCGQNEARVALVGLVLVTGQLISLAVQAGVLQDQARLQGLFYDAVKDLPPAVVLSDPPRQIWKVRPDLAEVGTWVPDLPHPDPYFRDRVLWVLASRADLELLRRTFPERRFYRLRAVPQGEPWHLEELSPGPPAGAVKSLPGLDTMPPFPQDTGASE